ncbi:MAG: ATP-binding protein [Ardenticatenaceae bacterium]|nr:ATP-binding protein [Ardenticatenaceae bacterium]MCB9442648.1 ATP-binding protein [Ardenticatenaceae bacterium]
MDQMRKTGYFRLDIPAVVNSLPVVSGTFSAILEQVAGIPERETTTYNVLLSVHEICTNIIEHAYENKGGRIEIDIQMDEQSGVLTVDLFDEGRSFELEEVPQPDLDSAPIRGYGLFLVRELMDKVSYVSSQERNHWHLVKRVFAPSR